MLLAQVPEISPLLTYFIEKGPLTAIFGLVMYLIWKYGATWFQGQIELVEVLKSSTKTNSDCNEANTKNLAVLTSSVAINAKIPKMLGHICEAAKNATDDPEVMRHLERALEERDR